MIELEEDEVALLFGFEIRALFCDDPFNVFIINGMPSLMVCNCKDMLSQERGLFVPENILDTVMTTDKEIFFFTSVCP